MKNRSSSLLRSVACSVLGVAIIQPNIYLQNEIRMLIRAQETFKNEGPNITSLNPNAPLKPKYSF